MYFRWPFENHPIEKMIFNTLRPGQNGRRFADDTFKRIFLNENFRISIKISLKFVPKGLINNNPALVQIMVWRWSGDKPLYEPMLVSLLTHICVTRPQWVKFFRANGHTYHSLLRNKSNFWIGHAVKDLTMFFNKRYITVVDVKFVV